MKILIGLLLLYFIALHVTIFVQQQDIAEKDDRIRVLERITPEMYIRPGNERDENEI